MRVDRSPTMAVSTLLSKKAITIEARSSMLPTVDSADPPMRC